MPTRRHLFIILLSLIACACAASLPEKKHATMKDEPLKIAHSIVIKQLIDKELTLPNNLNNKQAVVDYLLANLRLTEHRNLTINKVQNADELHIEILNNDMLDDSIKAIYYRFALALDTQNNWQLQEAKQAFQCRRSQTSEFSGRLCP